MLLVSIAALFLAGAQGNSASKHQYRPALILDLRTLGYEEPKNFHAQAEYQTLHNSAVFLDDDTLAISLFVRNPRPGLSVRGKVLGGSYLFQTFFLDVKSGKTLYTQTWSNSGIGCGLFPASNGTFVVSHGLELSLHSSDGTPLKSLSLDPKDFPRAVTVKLSPSGNTLFAVRSDQQGEHVLRIRTADLQILGWLDLPGYFTDSGSDSQFAFLRQERELPQHMEVYSLVVDPKAQTPKKIFTTSEECSSLTFLDEQTLGVSGQCHDLTILNTSGEVMFQQRFKGEVTGPIIPCGRCDLVVSSAYVLRGASALLDIFPKTKARSIILFNRKTRQLLEVPYTNAAKYVSSLALSRNGCLLAVQKDSLLEVYRICNSPIGAKLQGTPPGQ
jgi:hypothetical protein